MTTLINTYSFMDLLKDKRHVPEIDHSNTQIMLEIENAFETISDFALFDTASNDFMDLLNDKGYVPTANDFLPIAANDNYSIMRNAS